LTLPGGEAASVQAAPKPADVAAVAAAPSLPVGGSQQMRNTGPNAGGLEEDRQTGDAAAGDITILETLTASNIRNRPDATAGWIAEVPAGTQLRLLRRVEDRDWNQVEMPDGRTGFISGSLTRVLESGSVAVAALEEAEAPFTPAARPEAAEPRKVNIAAVDPTGLSSSQEFSDCAACPVMVTLPEGELLMGSSDSYQSEQPVRELTIGSPIAMGKYEVTMQQWHACERSGFCRRLGDPQPGDEARPVQNVSWADAETFVAWLRSETEQAYRLPTEAEWEFAARGGSESRFWWGDDYRDGAANCADCGGDWDRKKPSDIGSFAPNPFGLHDMQGGVSEWVADCWLNDYDGAPNNGAARSQSFCPQRVLRGGSWRSEADDIAASSRFRYDAQVRYYTNGFRVARDLN
jgi:formylglycine-generating enzyme required for sulfatase activity